MNIDWNIVLQIGGVIFFTWMMMRGGCCGGMGKKGCDTETKSQPRRDEDAATTREGDRQETELHNH